MTEPFSQILTDMQAAWSNDNATSASAAGAVNASTQLFRQLRKRKDPPQEDLETRTINEIHKENQGINTARIEAATGASDEMAKCLTYGLLVVLIVLGIIISILHFPHVFAAIIALSIVYKVLVYIGAALGIVAIGCLFYLAYKAYEKKNSYSEIAAGKNTSISLNNNDIRKLRF